MQPRGRHPPGLEEVLWSALELLFPPPCLASRRSCQRNGRISLLRFSGGQVAAEIPHGSLQDGEELGWESLLLSPWLTQHWKEPGAGGGEEALPLVGCFLWSFS